LRGAKRRSNPYHIGRAMDCFASLAMTMTAYRDYNRRSATVSTT
jgi:hypothetical protein